MRDRSVHRLRLAFRDLTEYCAGLVDLSPLGVSVEDER